jgi:hypothetical protein
VVDASGRGGRHLWWGMCEAENPGPSPDARVVQAEVTDLMAEGRPSSSSGRNGRARPSLIWEKSYDPRTIRGFALTRICTVMVAGAVTEHARAEKTERALRTLARAIAEDLWRSEVQPREMQPANGTGIPEGPTNALPPGNGQAREGVRDDE